MLLSTAQKCLLESAQVPHTSLPISRNNATERTLRLAVLHWDIAAECNSRGNTCCTVIIDQLTFCRRVKVPINREYGYVVPLRGVARSARRRSRWPNLIYISAPTPAPSTNSVLCLNCLWQ
ncbi:hypothetical protein J6590_032779 [Homalodisca vitripennis]|nr:hypothetical protein J6590_032779 [Homalodisca vitripennis]